MELDILSRSSSVRQLFARNAATDNGNQNFGNREFQHSYNNTTNNHYYNHPALDATSQDSHGGIQNYRTQAGKTRRCGNRNISLLHSPAFWGISVTIVIIVTISVLVPTLLARSDRSSEDRCG